MKIYILGIILLLSTSFCLNAKLIKLKSINPERLDANLYLPQNYKEHEKWPLIILLHSYGGSPKRIMSQIPLNKFQNKNGFMYLVPTGLNEPDGTTYWNASNVCCDLKQRGNNDIAYIKRLLDQIRSNPKLGRLDENKIFAIGFSNGAFFSHALACTQDIKINGIVTIGGTSDLRGNNGHLLDLHLPACKHNRPVSVLHVHGVLDKTIKYKGADFDDIGYLGAKAHVKRWAIQNKCQGRLTQSNIKLDAVPRIKGSETHMSHAKSCLKPVELYSVNKGSHYFKFNLEFLKKMLSFFKL